jgi:NADH dehydrogenase
MDDPHRVVIIGGGFGGLHAARALRSAPIALTVIDRRNFHLFQPLLYQVATGSLSPGEIAAPLRGVLGRQRNTRVLLGEVDDIDPAAKTVILRDGDRIPYDSLIVATGSQSFYYGHDEWREWAPSLKSVEEATAIRHKILYAFEAAERAKDPKERQAWLTFVIVGAGTTGVELAGALAEIARYTLKHDFRSFRPQDAQIFMLDGSARVLPTYPEDLSRKAEHSLVRMGVRVRNGVMVTKIDGDGVTFECNHKTERMDTKTVLWAGGVKISDLSRALARRTGTETDKSGRLKVNSDLTVPGFPDIFIVGDMALCCRPDGKPLPGVAQVAMQQGDYAANAIVRRLRGEAPSKPFHYFDKGDLAVIGRASAVANIFGLHMSGLIAWLVWLFVHLMYLVEFQSRILVFVQWGFQYITFSRGARLITGPTVPIADPQKTASPSSRPAGMS